MQRSRRIVQKAHGVPYLEGMKVLPSGVAQPGRWIGLFWFARAGADEDSS